MPRRKVVSGRCDWQSVVMVYQIRSTSRQTLGSCSCTLCQSFPQFVLERKERPSTCLLPRALNSSALSTEIVGILADWDADDSFWDFVKSHLHSCSIMPRQTGEEQHSNIHHPRTLPNRASSVTQDHARTFSSLHPANSTTISPSRRILTPLSSL
jgi:hypothetical protein